jgi:hypothetical protein
MLRAGGRAAIDFSRRSSLAEIPATHSRPSVDRSRFDEKETPSTADWAFLFFLAVLDAEYGTQIRNICSIPVSSSQFAVSCALFP